MGLCRYKLWRQFMLLAIGKINWNINKIICQIFTKMLILLSHSCIIKKKEQKNDRTKEKRD